MSLIQIEQSEYDILLSIREKYYSLRELFNRLEKSEPASGEKPKRKRKPSPRVVQMQRLTSEKDIKAYLKQKLG